MLSQSFSRWSHWISPRVLLLECLPITTFGMSQKMACTYSILYQSCQFTMLYDEASTHTSIGVGLNCNLKFLDVDLKTETEPYLLSYIIWLGAWFMWYNYVQLKSLGVRIRFSRKPKRRINYTPTYFSNLAARVEDRLPSAASSVLFISDSAPKILLVQCYHYFRIYASLYHYTVYSSHLYNAYSMEREDESHIS